MVGPFKAVNSFLPLPFCTVFAWLASGGHQENFSVSYVSSGGGAISPQECKELGGLFVFLVQSDREAVLLRQGLSIADKVFVFESGGFVQSDGRPFHSMRRYQALEGFRFSSTRTSVVEKPGLLSVLLLLADCAAIILGWLCIYIGAT